MKSIKSVIIAMILIINYNLDSYALKITKTINIAGLIVDSKTLLPVSEATVYDERNKRLGVTNANGFFNVNLILVKDGDIDFKLTIKKPGYELYAQKEHWSNLGSDLYVTYYFGIQNISGKARPFSEFAMNGKTSSYDEIRAGFNKIKEKLDLDNKIETAKTGNDNLLFEIDNNYYLISETGWLKLNSANDHISINGTESKPAKEINSVVKRRNVKSMSTSGNKSIPFEINTY